MMIQDKFIDRLKKAMRSRDVNARELARRSGLSEGAISRYLSGKMEPRVPAIGKMADALHVDPVWLLGYDMDEAVPSSEFEDQVTKKYFQLDMIDRVKAEAYIDGLLAADKYKKDTESRLA